MTKITVADLGLQFISWTQANRSTETLKKAKAKLKLLQSQLTPKFKAVEVKPYHLSQVIAQNPTWSKTTQQDFIVGIKRMFTWATEQGYLDKNPIQHMRPPSRETSEEFISEEEFTLLRSLAKTVEFRDLVTFAWETGVRPQEARLIEVGDLDAVQGIISLPKARSKGGRYARTIYLTPLALEIAKTYAVGRTSGPLFRSPRGRRWQAGNLYQAFRTLSKKTGKRFKFGHLRKGYATQALINGVDVITLSHLMGHQDTSMLAKHYAKVHKNVKHMAESAIKAKGGT